MIKIDDVEFDEVDGDQAPRILIWLDAHPYAKDNPPSISISISGRAKQCTLAGLRQRLAPAMYVSAKFPGSDWHNLSSFALSNDAPKGTNFFAWCGQPDDSDVLAYDLRLIARQNTMFTLECHSDLVYRDNDSPTRLYILRDVPLQHLAVGVPATSVDPLMEAEQLVKRWLDPSTWCDPIVHEQRVPADGSVVALTVLYSPIGDIVANNPVECYSA